MADYIDIEQAKSLDGLRIVAPPGRPKPKSIPELTDNNDRQ